LQGEGGFIPAPIAWVKAVRQICDKYGIMFIADEVQTGFCRTGRMFATQYWAEAGVWPDIITIAKSIAGGVPLSAIIVPEERVETLPKGTIGGTFCGNPLACASALAVIETMQKEDFAKRSLKIGETVTAFYKKLADKYDVIGDYRGLGAMLGLEFVTSRETKEPNSALVSAIVKETAQRGLIIESAGISGNVIRFLAPLVITDEQLDSGLKILDESIGKCLSA